MNLSSNKKAIIAIIAIVVIVAAFVVLSKKFGGFGDADNQQSSTLAPISKDAAFNTNLNQVDFDAPVSVASSKNITAAEKRAIYESLLAGYKTMTSGNATAMRAYMLAKASTAAEKNFVNKMTDADLVSLSSRLGETMIMPTPELLLTSTSVWNRDGNTVTIEYADPSTGTTTKKVVYIDGKWY